MRTSLQTKRAMLSAAPRQIDGPGGTIDIQNAKIPKRFVVWNTVGNAETRRSSSLHGVPKVETPFRTPFNAVFKIQNYQLDEPKNERFKISKSHMSKLNKIVSKSDYKSRKLKHGKFSRSRARRNRRNRKKIRSGI